MAIITALSTPLLIGGAGLGVEVGMWRYDQVRLQQAADAAAYAAGVVARSGSGSPSNAASIAMASNGFAAASDTVTLNSPSTATPNDASSVEVVLTHPETPLFSSIFKSRQAVLTARATASYNTAADACILALSPGASKAMNFAGNSGLQVSGCALMSDSLAPDAMNIQGSTVVSAPCLYSAGGVSAGGTVNLSTCAAPKANQPPVADPYKSLVMPTVTGMCKNGKNGPSNNEFHYCDLSLKGTQTLAPGTYIIDGGSLDIAANSNTTASGVTFFLTNGATATFNGTAIMNFSPPSTGPYAGFLLIADRSDAGPIKINGDASSLATGIIYAPAAEVDYIGNFAGAGGGCTQIVSSTVLWSGNTRLTDDCSKYNMSKAKLASPVQVIR